MYRVISIGTVIITLCVECNSTTLALEQLVSGFVHKAERRHIIYICLWDLIRKIKMFMLDKVYGNVSFTEMHPMSRK